MEIWNYQVVQKLFFFYRHVCYILLKLILYKHET